MKKTHLILLLLLLTTCYVRSQSVSGKIVDQNNQPIPYATIQIGDDYGVVSNTEGIFSIFTTNQPTDAKVTISYMGYESLEMPLKDFKSITYVLKEKVNELSEVFVTNKELTAEEIVTRMLEKAPENYKHADYSQTFFMRTENLSKLIDFQFEVEKATDEKRRDLKKLNQEIESLIGNLKGKKSRDYVEYYGKYYRLKDSTKAEIEKAVILKDKSKDISSDQLNKKIVNIVRKYLEPGSTYKVKTGLFKIADSLKTDEVFDEETDSTKGKSTYIKGNITFKNKYYTTFYKDEDLDFFDKMKRYEFKLEGYTNIDNETAYVISFKPDRGSAIFYGKMYINAFDFGVMRLDYTMVEGENLHNINLKLILGIKFTEDRINVSTVYKKNENGQYTVKFGKKQTGTYAYISRPLKFTKNKADEEEDKKKMKLDFTIEIDNYTTEEFYVLDEKQLTSEDFKAVKDQKNYKPIEIKYYDPTIWDGYNIIAPIEAIKEYGKE